MVMIEVGIGVGIRSLVHLCRLLGSSNFRSILPRIPFPKIIFQIRHLLPPLLRFPPPAILVVIITRRPPYRIKVPSLQASFLVPGGIVTLSFLLHLYHLVQRALEGGDGALSYPVGDGLGEFGHDRRRC